MTDSNPLRDPFLLGEIRVEPARNSLLAGEDKIALEPRIMDVLCLLAARAGDVVTRESIIEEVWGTEHFGDESLTRAVSIIRKGIREAGETQEYVETIPRRGYRVSQPVTLLEDESAPIVKSAKQAPDSPRVDAPKPARIVPGIAVLLGVLVIVSIALLTVVQQTKRSPAQSADSTVTGDDASETTTSIAVLPFTALSQKEEDRVFADGVAVNLLTQLAGITDLEVAGQRSSFAYRDQNLDLRTIGNDLGVSHLLDGTFQRSDEDIRLYIQLVRSSDGVQVWNQTYDAPLTDVFKIQDDIVRQLGRQLEIELGVGRYRERTSGEGIDPRAVEQYYLGLGYYGERMRNDVARFQAYDAFQNAVAIDPDFGEAWTGIAMVGSTSFGSPLSRDFEKFRRDVSHAFERSFALAPENPSTHAAMVFWSLGAAFDMEAARVHVERGLELAPQQADVMYADAALKLYSGDVANGLDLYE